jgi:hypothetical protein
MFAIQFAWCLIVLILFGVGYADAPYLVVPVLIHLAALVYAGYAARPGRLLQDQYAFAGLTVAYGVAWTTYGLGYASRAPNISAAYAGYVLAALNLVFVFVTTKQFKREAEADAQLDGVHPAPQL